MSNATADTTNPTAPSATRTVCKIRFLLKQLRCNFQDHLDGNDVESITTPARSCGAQLDPGERGTVFGAPLDHILAFASTTITLANSTLHLPILVVYCVESIYSATLASSPRSSSAAGLFRTLPKRDRHIELIRIFDSDTNNYGVHLLSAANPSNAPPSPLQWTPRPPDLCAVLSTFITHIPNPLLHPALLPALWAWCIKPSIKRANALREYQEHQYEHRHSQSRSRSRHGRFNEHRNPLSRTYSQAPPPLPPFSTEPTQIRVAALLLRLLSVPQYSLFVYLLTFFSHIPLPPDASTGEHGDGVAYGDLAPEDMGPDGRYSVPAFSSARTHRPTDQQYHDRARDVNRISARRNSSRYRPPLPPGDPSTLFGHVLIGGPSVVVAARTMRWLLVRWREIIHVLEAEQREEKAWRQKGEQGEKSSRERRDSCVKAHSHEPSQAGIQGSIASGVANRSGARRADSTEGGNAWRPTPLSQDTKSPEPIHPRPRRTQSLAHIRAPVLARQRTRSLSRSKSFLQATDELSLIREESGHSHSHTIGADSRASAPPSPGSCYSESVISSWEGEGGRGLHRTLSKRDAEAKEHREQDEEAEDEGTIVLAPSTRLCERSHSPSGSDLDSEGCPHVQTRADDETEAKFEREIGREKDSGRIGSATVAAAHRNYVSTRAENPSAPDLALLIDAIGAELNHDMDQNQQDDRGQEGLAMEGSGAHDLCGWTGAETERLRLVLRVLGSDDGVGVRDRTSSEQKIERDLSVKISSTPGKSSASAHIGTPSPSMEPGVDIQSSIGIGVGKTATTSNPRLMTEGEMETETLRRRVAEVEQQRDDAQALVAQMRRFLLQH